jgi:hypothetical protein
MWSDCVREVAWQVVGQFPGGWMGGACGQSEPLPALAFCLPPVLAAVREASRHCRAAHGCMHAALRTTNCCQASADCEHRCPTLLPSPCAPPPPAVLWESTRHLGAAYSGTSRAGAMSLTTRLTLLPRSVAGAGNTAMSDVLLFENRMRRNLTEYAQGE